MRLIFRLFVLLLALAPVALAALVWFSLSAQPAAGGPALSYHDIERAQTILKQNDPRRLVPGATRRVMLSEGDLGVALRYLAHKYARGSAQVVLEQGRMRAVVALPVPVVPARPYLNVDVALASRGGLPELAALRVGSVPVPPRLAGWLLRQALERLYSVDELTTAIGAVRDITLRPGQLALSYRWEPETVRALGTRLAGADDARLAFYQDELLALQRNGKALTGSIAPVLQALFHRAQQRSATASAGFDPVAENRALLLILGAWASEHGTRTLVPRARHEPRPFALSLQARRDWAQHFLVSAALAAGGDNLLSHAAGVFKEVSDSRGGSGFSFGDLAADRAGTRFGQLATASRAGALTAQRLLQEGIVEADIMPPARDLPENLREGEFDRRYGGVDAPEYQRVVTEIDRRVAACRLYRD
jgi:uncharacterized protein YfiM (DUF2279 family)